MKKIIIIYANCQGDIGLKYFLSKLLPNYLIYSFANYKYIKNKKKLDYNIFKLCDIFIYQPLNKKYKEYSTDICIKESCIHYLKKKCIKISFPYIYNNALWVLTTKEWDGIDNLKIIKKNSDYVYIENQEIIINLIRKGYSLNEIIDKFNNLEIDFDIKNRYKISLLILKEKEKKCDIKIVDYIIKNIRYKKLFLTKNHPTTHIFIHLIKQILSILKINKDLSIFTNISLNACELPGYEYNSIYDNEYFKFLYDNKYNNYYYIKLINIIYCNYMNISNILENITLNKYGIEIGGPSNTGKIIYKNSKRVDNIIYNKNTIWSKHNNVYEYDKNKIGKLIINDAVNIEDVKYEKYDFLFASHVLEHIANPLKAIKEWLRIIKKDGYIILILPEKSLCFDHKRDYSLFTTLLEKFDNNVGEDDLSSLPEILYKHDLSRDKPAGNLKKFEKRCLNNYKNRCMHHYVYNIKLLDNICDFFKCKFIYTYTKDINIWYIMKKI